MGVVDSSNTIIALKSLLGLLLCLSKITSKGVILEYRSKTPIKIKIYPESRGSRPHKYVYEG